MRCSHSMGFKQPTVWIILALSCGGGLQAVEPPSRPNILFCIADDWGWPHAGAYGSKFVETPTFDRLAQEGALFMNAFTSNPKCAPCRASIVTGRNSWQLEEGVNHFNPWPAKFVSYPDLLTKAGYHVGMTGKGWGPGDWKSFRDTDPAGPLYDKFSNETPGGQISNIDYSRNFIENFLPERQPGQPWCFWLGTKEPHRAYEDGNGLRRGKRLEDAEVPGFFPDEDVVRSDLLDYAIEVEWYDTHVGRVIEHLRQTGELDNTIVVMTSDHGMPFPRVKGQIYEMGFHLPLVIRWGDVVKPGRVVDDFINVRDFAPTFLEMAGVEKHAQITGKSFVDVLKASESGVIDPSRNVMLTGKERHDLGRPYDWGYPVRAIRTPEYLYVFNFETDRWPAGDPETGYRNVDGSPTKTRILQTFDEYYEMSFGKRPERALYAIQTDPECMNNLAFDPARQGLVESLHTRMIAMLTAEGDPRVTGNAAFFDTIPYLGQRGHSWDTWLKSQTGKDQNK
jgi:N-sulfoglucosamine sulfohydrolase